MLESILEQRDVQMQLLALVMVMIGNLGMYFAWKRYGSENDKITRDGILKKIFVGFAGWVALLFQFTYITPINWDTIGHLYIIFIGFEWGIGAEIIGGAYIQQIIEKWHGKRKVEPDVEVKKEDGKNEKSV